MIFNRIFKLLLLLIGAEKFIFFLSPSVRPSLKAFFDRHFPTQQSLNTEINMDEKPNLVEVYPWDPPLVDSK